MSPVNQLLLAFILIQFKHLIIDWIWQPPYEHQNKGIYGHWGGIQHAFKNAIGTATAVGAAFSFASGPLVLLVFVFDFIVHYHIDWMKKQVVARYDLHPMKDPEFWWATGVDQFAHQLTYLFILWYVANRFF
ncbi:MAG: DUF3307 domain-containing protein [Verrucomicrobiaceae bacterium]|nr:MAG: DUF3307 domain-containing protein [Verrucomicrobiaceae bacterium]